MRPTYPLTTKLNRSIALSVAERLSHNEAAVFYLDDTKAGGWPSWAGEDHLAATRLLGDTPALRNSAPEVLNLATEALAKGTQDTVRLATRYGDTMLRLLSRLDWELSKPDALRRLASRIYLRDEHFMRQDPRGQWLRTM